MTGAEMTFGGFDNGGTPFYVPDPQIAKELDQLRARVETLREALNWVANMPEYDQDDAHRLRNIAKTKLAAVDAAENKT